MPQPAPLSRRSRPARARAHQQHHWLEHVFAGNFNQDYLEATLAIGRTHQRLGVDLRFYSGAYVVVLNQVVQLLDELVQDAATRSRYLTAINRAVFLDMGLATYAYYDTLLNALEDMAQEVTLSLARAGEYRDNETGKHITRMSKMCEQMALALGKDATWAHALRMASPLHDVGKIGVPDRILLKPGRLDEAEFQIMREHPRIGGTIIPEHPALVIRMARRIALTHHEKWDGSGYPPAVRRGNPAGRPHCRHLRCLRCTGVLAPTNRPGPSRLHWTTCSRKAAITSTRNWSNLLAHRAGSRRHPAALRRGNRLSTDGRKAIPASPVP
jgi:putative two-component system response regulator